jgi:hypothetical protein
MLSADVAKVAAIIYAVETLSLVSNGEVQTLAPEAFVPAAVRILQEAEKVQGLGVDTYLAGIEVAKATAAVEEVEQRGPGPDEELEA